ncbi:MAG: HipA domain-containing protein [Rhodospirillales bacterium]|nr:HipA domain-containing protein [Rhodospirillales bacterium]
MSLTEIYKKEAGDTLGVYWYDRPIGLLHRRDGEIFWEGQSPQYFRIFGVQDGAEEPAVIRNLQPEGWLSGVLHYKDQWEYLKEGLCFLSNLRIVAPENKDSFLALAPRDVLKGRIRDFVRPDGVFSGSYQGPSGHGLAPEMARSVAAFWNDKTMPRLSGAQMKLPVCLHGDGRLVPALGTGNSFTHILKLPGGERLESVAALEWLCLRVSEKAGVKTARHALVEMPDGLPPATLVERFDIPRNEVDARKILMQDFCSLAKIPSHEKDKGSVEQCARLLKGESINWEHDRVAFFDRVVLSYALRDGDMHRKNLSILKKIEGCDPDTLNVEFAPAYDMVSTAVYKNGDQMILPLNGKKEGLNRKTWEYFGRTLGMDPKEAADRALSLIERVASSAVEVCRDLPPEIRTHPGCVYDLQRATTEMVDLARKNGLNTPEWEGVYEEKAAKPSKEDAHREKRHKIRIKRGLEYKDTNPFSLMEMEI